MTTQQLVKKISVDDHEPLEIKVKMASEYVDKFYCEQLRDPRDRLNAAKNNITKVKQGLGDRGDRVWRDTVKSMYIAENIPAHYKNVAKFQPSSRAFFKLNECIVDLELLPSNTDGLTTVHLAEGPGGFIENVQHIRKNPADVYHGFTLPVKGSHLNFDESLVQSDESMGKIKVHYGDLYQLKDIETLVNAVGANSVDFVTGDGGFDVSGDWNHQEQLSHQIIYSEILAAVLLLKTGGHFVCKLFDTFSDVQIQMLEFLATIFETVYLIKPVTSRPANSERYVVCKDFLGISEKAYNPKKLKSIVNAWTKTVAGGKVFTKLFDGGTTSEPDETHENPITTVRDNIIEFANTFADNQIKAINNNLRIITNNINIDTFDAQREYSTKHLSKYFEV